MIAFDPATASFRGPSASLDHLISALSTDDELSTVLAAHASGIAADPTMDGIRGALTAPLFRVGITVSGPGAQQHHDLLVGANGVGVRRSPLKDGLAELTAYPIGTLPGGMTRLVRFLPGTAPTPEQGPIRVPQEQLVRLTDPDAATRVAAWSGLDPLIGDVLGPAADDSWQIVEARSSWTSLDEEPGEDLVVQIRRAEHHLLIEEENGSASLRPVTSLRAWEEFIRVLPEHDEVGAPR